MCVSACRNSAAMWLKLGAFFNQCTRIVTNSRSASNKIQEFTGILILLSVGVHTGLGIARRVVVEVEIVWRIRNGYPPASDHSGSDRYLDRCPLNMAGIEIWRRYEVVMGMLLVDQLPMTEKALDTRLTLMMLREKQTELILLLILLLF
uniref:Uncharacterized protein n=1 Tax=Chenopodium quinoa TaxID=63459 RepID=A0A803LX86_CHEQI